MKVIRGQNAEYSGSPEKREVNDDNQWQQNGVQSGAAMHLSTRVSSDLWTPARDR
jgi:hypothetical protein